MSLVTYRMGGITAIYKRPLWTIKLVNILKKSLREKFRLELAGLSI